MSEILEQHRLTRITAWQGTGQWYFLVYISSLPVGLRVLYPRNNWFYVSLYNPGLAFTGINIETFLLISKAITVI